MHITSITRLNKKGFLTNRRPFLLPGLLRKESFFNLKNQIAMSTEINKKNETPVRDQAKQHSSNEITSLRQQIAAFQKRKSGAIKLNTLRTSLGIFKHHGNDTYKIRVKSGGGVISTKQLTEVAHTARQYGTGEIHLTSRQEIEILNIPLEHTPDALVNLQHHKLDVSRPDNNIGNITTSEDAGTSYQEKFDTIPHVLTLNKILNNASESTLSPIKLRIGFTSDYRDNSLARYNDIGFIATTRDGNRGFRVFIGGVSVSTPTPGYLLSGFLEEKEILYVIETVKRIIQENNELVPRHGTNLRSVIDALGREKAFKLFASYYLKIRNEKDNTLRLTELNSSTIAPPETGKINYPLLSREWVYRYVRDQKQSGLFSVELPLAKGNIRATDIEKLAYFLSPFGNDVIRLSVHQHFFLRNIPGVQLLPLQNLLKEISLQNERNSGDPHSLNGLSIQEQAFKTGSM
jgi:sulfite reductase (ferredoxin)